MERPGFSVVPWEPVTQLTGSPGEVGSQLGSHGQELGSHGQELSLPWYLDFPSASYVKNGIKAGHGGEYL